jgi:hypothetical protein
MKIRVAVALVLLTALASSAPLPPPAQASVESAVRNARAVITAAHFSTDDIAKILAEVLDACLAIVPEGESAAEFRSRIGTARTMLLEKELFSDKVRQYIGLSYKLISGGPSWEIPKEITDAAQPKDGIKLATKICLELVDSALVEWKAGRNAAAVIRLLSFVLLVITPIQA